MNGSNWVVAYVDNEEYTEKINGVEYPHRGFVREYRAYDSKGVAERYKSSARDIYGRKPTKRDVEDGKIVVLSREEFNKLADEKAPSSNILNPNSKVVWMTRATKGGCTDPGTETYHSM